jgi:hypothetical protein
LEQAIEFRRGEVRNILPYSLDYFVVGRQWSVKLHLFEHVLNFTGSIQTKPDPIVPPLFKGRFAPPAVPESRQEVRDMTDFLA